MRNLNEPQVIYYHRYQAAIIRDGKILLIMHREHDGGRAYWVIPGGGREAGETEEECVAREAWEETGLVVRVEGLILDWRHPKPRVYQSFKTYLCTILSGQEKPGYEPEEYASSQYAIVDVRWVDLADDIAWGELIRNDPFTFPQLKAIQRWWGGQRAL